MKQLYVGSILWIIFCTPAWCQEDIRETVYVHLNAQNFVSGETLYFSAYCNSQVTGRPSQLSKILYVELVGPEGAVHQQKVRLEEGRGHGEFFISSVVPSGRYYLIAYTRWMKNFREYFHAPVLIINPYESYSNPNLEKGAEIIFSPDAGLVAGIENTVAYHLQADEPKSYSGRLVDGSGKGIDQLNPDEWGVGSFKLTPKAGENYQVILSDASGKVTFHQLPAVKEDGYRILSRTDGKSMTVYVKSAGGSMGQVRLTVFSGGSIQYEANINANEEHDLILADLDRTLLWIRAYSDTGSLLAEKPVYLGNQYEDLGGDHIYAPREQVSMDLPLLKGTYSVSVRKTIDPRLDQHNHAVFGQGINPMVKAPQDLPAYLSSSKAEIEAFFQMCAFDPPNAGREEYVRWLPEFREEILTGTVRDSAGNPINNQLIALSFPNENYQLRIGKTNSTGSFVVPFQSSWRDYEAVITTIQPYQAVSVEVDNPFLQEYPDFDFELPHLDSLLVVEILKRNVRSQIQNAYYLQEEVTRKRDDWPVTFAYDDTYFLDNYERFPTLKETFTEYIVSANFREKRDDIIQTTFDPGIGQRAYSPLILLDGVPVKGEDLMDLNPGLLSSIKIVLNRYFLGPLTMDGVVDIATRQHQLEGFSLGHYHHLTPIMGLSQTVGLPKPEWINQPDTPVPDQREQLLWLPLFRPGEAEDSFTFTTSDVCGEYELVVEGFDVDGEPVSIVRKFSVR